MIELDLVDGTHAPFFCDICGERIKDASKGAVVHENFRSDKERAKALYVHKGSIDDKTCHAKAEALIQGGGGISGWEELKSFLCNLATNTGFSPQNMADYDKRDKP